MQIDPNSPDWPWNRHHRVVSASMGPFAHGSDLVAHATPNNQQPEGVGVFEENQSLEELRQKNAQRFIEFMMSIGALRFGEFKTKAGRLSPYFLNAGLFSDGASLGQLANAYADCLAPELGQGSFVCDMLFGPAYKGIPLVSTTAVMLEMRYGRNLPYAYNRKEAKDHGEGGVIVGAHIRGKVLIIDDVISAGTSVRESVELIRGAGAEPAGVLIALDRQERGQGELSAVQEVNKTYGIPVFSIATLEDIIAYLELMKKMPLNPDIVLDVTRNLERVLAYKAEYGVEVEARHGVAS